MLYITITKAKETLKVFKAITFTECGKMGANCLHLKAITRPILKYTNTIISNISINCKPFKPQLQALPLVAQETQTLNTYMNKCSSNGHLSRTSCYSIKTTELNKNSPFISSLFTFRTTQKHEGLNPL